MKLSVVIPAYNEEKTIVPIVTKVLSSIEENRLLINEYELIIIDDGSKDSTTEILKKNFTNNQKIKLIFIKKNTGKGAALAKGFAQTTGDIVLIQDADLEYDPSDYLTLLGPILNDKADVVFGSRFKGGVARAFYFSHYLGNLLLTFLSNMFTDLNLTDMEVCYKVYRGNIIRNMVLTSKRFGVEPEMTAKIAKIKGIRIYEVPISYYGRTYVEGKKIGWKDGLSAIWSIFKFNLLTTYKTSFLPGFKFTVE